MLGAALALRATAATGGFTPTEGIGPEAGRVSAPTGDVLLPAPGLPAPGGDLLPVPGDAGPGGVSPVLASLLRMLSVPVGGPPPPTG
ncbi:hypothetical protein GCM10017600_13290 [Streptosporangium carneum]|uniref:Uncharacterized protein n=1 Tax=Streptosporangium carneum TaxID=47481 RepID=A0A9W6HYW6_9ACTN|nr:hypothetical protein GCM10017600_13290 [Streptosporangium carneum]